MSRSSALNLAPLACVVALAACGSNDPPPVQDLSRSSSTTGSDGPVYYPGNPDCADLGLGTVELKVEPPNGGTYDLGGGQSVTVEADGTYIDWSSTIGIDAVIVKGGDNAYVYEYDPEATGDNGLSAPINPNTQRPYGLSHFNFCYDWEVEVAKTADTSLTRTYDWTIDKTGASSDLLLSAGQTYTMSYSVIAAVSGWTDSDWAVSGTISVHNPAPHDAIIATVSDVLDSSEVTVDCGVALPFTLGSGETLNCSYASNLDSDASLTNHAYVATTEHSLVGGGEATAAVDFAGADVTGVDACVDVDDDKYGVLGTVCADASPITFDYLMDIGPFAVCGPQQFENTACLMSHDSQTQACDTWHVNIEVADCGGGCSLTPGYWKTHSDEGPAPYDDNWQNVGPLEEDTAFYSSGGSYYDVLWTAPRGNAYYILARAYIAAYLNGLNGADTSSISAELAEAEAIFADNTPEQVGRLKGPRRRVITDLATTLDKYNNGSLGPGHCDE